MKRTDFALKAAKALALACCCSLLVTGLSACGPRPQPKGELLTLLVSPAPDRPEEGGRVSPVYEQWLYRQSMLGQAQDLAASLSGSRLLWRHTAAAQDRALVRQAAPTWLVVDMAQLAAPALSSLEQALPSLAQKGIGGLWLAHVCESDSAWTPEQAPHAYRQAALGLPKKQGTEEDFSRLVEAMQAKGLQCGMDIVPLATGLGPDFMLQARGSARHQGMYVMAEVPDQYWPLLPATTRPWDCEALSADTIRALTERHVLPGPLRQESFADAVTLWAVTGPVLGVDGRTRRLVYRALSSPWQPILFWQDPGGAARTTLAGSIISVTGLRRQTLAGLSAQGLAGLDAAGQPSAAQLSGDLARAPAGQALSDLSQQIRRYGGWSLIRDGHDLALVQARPDAGDFSAALDVDRAYDKAFAGGDAHELARALTELLSCGVPAKTMAFASARAPDGAAPARPAPGEAAASLAELAAARAHLACALPVGLPGLCFLDAKLYAGASGFGQAANQAPSCRLLLQEALAARSALRLADGTLSQVLLPAPGVLACVTSLPQDGLFVTVLNFSQEQAQCHLALPAGTNAQEPACLTQGSSAQLLAPDHLVLSLKPRQAAHFLVGTTAGGIR